QRPPRRSARDPRARRGAARAGAARRLPQPTAHAALRRATSARRPRPRPRPEPARAPPRRALRRPRHAGPPRAARVATPLPRANPGDHPPRHPRPGGGARALRARRVAAWRPGRTSGEARRPLREPRQRLRRVLPGRRQGPHGQRPSGPRRAPGWFRRRVLGAGPRGARTRPGGRRRGGGLRAPPRRPARAPRRGPEPRPRRSRRTSGPRRWTRQGVGAAAGWRSHLRADAAPRARGARHRPRRRGCRAAAPRQGRPAPRLRDLKAMSTSLQGTAPRRRRVSPSFVLPLVLLAARAHAQEPPTYAPSTTQEPPHPSADLTAAPGDDVTERPFVAEPDTAADDGEEARPSAPAPAHPPTARPEPAKFAPAKSASSSSASAHSAPLPAPPPTTDARALPPGVQAEEAPAPRPLFPVQAVPPDPGPPVGIAAEAGRGISFRRQDGTFAIGLRAR